jgi:hypothetical protein
MMFQKLHLHVEQVQVDLNVVAADMKSLEPDVLDALPEWVWKDYAELVDYVSITMISAERLKKRLASVDMVHE